MRNQNNGNRWELAIATFFLVLCVCFFVKAEEVSAETVASGTIGATDNITWVLDNHGVLTISGDGTMPGYSLINVSGKYVCTAPWAEYSEKILYVYIDGEITNIGDYAFDLCSNLTVVYIISNVQSIGTHAFGGCAEVKSIHIPSGVQTLGSNVFSNCSPIEVYYSGSEEDWSSNSNWGSSSIFTYSRICFGVSSGNFSNEQLGNKFHWDLYSDGSLFISGQGDIPDFEETAAPWYSEKSNVRSVTFREGIIRLGNNAFYGCDQLNNAYLPDSLVSIGKSAFEQCVSLDFISIPDGVKALEDNAFAFCHALTGVIIPKSIDTVGNNVFMGCSALENVYFPGTKTEWKELPKFDSPETINSLVRFLYATGTAGDSVTWCLFDDGFMNVSGFGYISEYTYAWETPWYSVRTEIEKVRVDFKISRIGRYAFSECNRLTSVVANSCIYISTYAFAYDVSLSTFKSEKGFCGGTYAFIDCLSLTEVPLIRRLVGEYAFSGCTKLSEVSLAGCVIYKYAFSGCVGLVSVDIEGPVGINNYAFYCCSGLKNIVLPEKCARIGDYAFFGCSNLETISIPSCVTSIGSYAFGGCFKLTAIHLPDNIEIINGHTFYGCTGLSTIIIPDAVNEVAENAFEGCTGLELIVLPENIETIGDYAFYSCSGLVDVYYKGTEADWDFYLSIGEGNECLTNATFHFGLFQAATEVQNAIANIGIVSYTSECWEKITSAFTQYNALSDFDKSMVANLSALKDAEAAFTELEAQDTSHSVLLTSRIPDGKFSVIPVSGGGMYYSIRGGDIQAYESIYYDFVGWYQDYGTSTEKELGTSLILHVTPQDTMNITAVYQPAKDQTFTVTITADAFIYGNDETVYFGTKTFTCTPGEEITITYTDNNSDLICWLSRDRQPISRSESITLCVNEDMQIEANSVDQGAGGNCAVVVFEDETGNTISARFYFTVDVIVFPYSPEVTGKTFEKWSMTQYEIKKQMKTDYYIHVKAVFADE